MFAGGLVPALASPPPIELFTRRPLVGSVSISADGRHLVYLSADDRGHGTLAGVNFETMAPFSISLGGDDIYTLSWLTGDRIAFNVAMNRRWSRGLYTYRLGDKVAEGINERDLTLGISVVRKDPSRLYVWYYGAVSHRQKGLALIDTDRRAVAGMGRADEEFMVVRWVPAPPGEVLDWIADRTGQVRVGVTFHDGRKRVWIHGSDTERWSELPFDWEHASIAGFSMDGRALLVRTDDGSAATDGLFLYDLESRSLGELVFRDPDFGLDDAVVLRAVEDEAIVGIRYLRDRVTTHWMSERFRGYQAAIDERLPGRVNHIRDWDNAERRLIVETQSDRQPDQYFAYLTGDGSIMGLPAASPWIDPSQMQPMQTVNYKARDGLPLQGYLTLPARAADGRKPALVVMPHGGPWVRDVWGWDPHVQFLASRGYAVFQPNYRGSSGFTREVSGERTAFRQMYEDVADGAAVVARSGLVDPERIAIYGGSFGGYLAIAAAAFDPDRFKCAISFAGVFDWARLVDQTRFRREASYLRHLRRRDVGDPGTDEERFAEISPIKHVANIRIPLPLAHGGLDRVVEDAQTKALIAELRKHRCATRRSSSARRAMALPIPATRRSSSPASSSFSPATSDPERSSRSKPRVAQRARILERESEGTGQEGHPSGAWLLLRIVLLIRAIREIWGSNRLFELIVAVGIVWIRCRRGRSTASRPRSATTAFCFAIAPRAADWVHRAMLLFLTLCLVSRFAYSVNDILVGRLARERTGLEVATWRGLTLGVTMAPWLLFVPREAWAGLPAAGWDVAGLLVVTAVGNVLQLQASRYMPFGVRAAFIVSGIAACSGVLGWLVLGERMSWTEAGLSLLVVGSAVLSALGEHASHEIKPDMRRGAFFAIGGAVFIALMGLFVARLARATDPLLTAWVWEFGGGLVLAVLLAVRYARGGVPTDLGRLVRRTAVAASPTVLGSGFSALALTMGSLGVWAAVAGTQVLFTAVLGAWWHKEIVGARRWVYFAIASAAIGALGWFGTAGRSG